MSGIGYDLKKIRALVFDVDGVLSPSTIPMNNLGEPERMVNIKDGYALQLAAKTGYKIAIITGGKGEAIRHRYEALGVHDIFMGAGKKITVLQQWLEGNKLQADEVMYMGDDIPDIECMRLVGLPCAPSDACAEARITAKYISRFMGGYGCARDVIEQILKARGDWMKDSNAFGW
ncbi:MAG: HAD hydrolase-like protein [Bacteroidales bacterium]|nr:HAD hydrolase-like protein [Bacteroidales bacterium]MBD5206450.1 HAD hydrolase-like protein [Bacteroidales bacterium]MBD5224246.1 HAD hydrolase-like protein [Bacteroidales bacterium]MBD5301660.1 HAD hydrolase-like protein [Bacteroides sp.]